MKAKAKGRRQFVVGVFMQALSQAKLMHHKRVCGEIVGCCRNRVWLLHKQVTGAQAVRSDLISDELIREYVSATARK